MTKTHNRVTKTYNTIKINQKIQNIQNINKIDRINENDARIIM